MMTEPQSIREKCDALTEELQGLSDAIERAALELPPDLQVELYRRLATVTNGIRDVTLALHTHQRDGGSGVH